MIREELIKRMVRNYYGQIDLLEKMGRPSDMSLREYLEGIKDASSIMTQEEVDYGLLLERESQ